MSVPKLRFKSDDGQEFPAWKTELLGSYAETISSGKSNARNDSGTYIFFGSTGAIGYADDYDYQGEKLLIARVGANAGYLYRVDGNYCVSDNTLMLTLNRPHNYSFFFNLLTKVNLNKLVFGSGQPLITGGHLKNLAVAIPSLPEQAKIANFLSAVDEKISQLTQKHSLLTQYKKGVMQQIFSQELRFKDDDGRDFPEWHQQIISNVIDNYGGTALEEFVSNEGTHHFISIGNYEKNGNYFDNGQRISLNAKTKQKLLNKGDLVMVLNDKTLAGDLIGSTLLIKEDNKFIYNQRSERLVCNMQLVEPGYIWQLFNSTKFRKEIFSISQGGTQIYVNFPAVKKLIIPVPSLKEQTKIANFLSTIDDAITATKRNLDAMRQYKQGLLQQMFV